MDAPRDVVYTVHEARKGVAWLKDAWALVSGAWLRWLLLVLLYYVVMILANRFSSQLLVPFLKPVFAVGFLAAAWTQERGGTLRMRDLFLGFRSNLRALLVLGAAFVAGITVAVMSTALVDGGNLLETLTAPAPATAEERETWSAALNVALQEPRTQAAMLFAVVVALPTIAAMWFAPGLVVFQDLPATSALVHSLRAAMANWRPLVVYALAVFVMGGLVPGIALAILMVFLPPSVASVVGIALLPFVLLFAATLQVSDYVSYRDVFHAGETLAPLTPGRSLADG